MQHPEIIGKKSPCRGGDIFTFILHEPRHFAILWLWYGKPHVHVSREALHPRRWWRTSEKVIQNFLETDIGKVFSAERTLTLRVISDQRDSKASHFLMKWTEGQTTKKVRSYCAKHASSVQFGLDGSDTRQYWRKIDNYYTLEFRSCWMIPRVLKNESKPCRMITDTSSETSLSEM